MTPAEIKTLEEQLAEAQDKYLRTAADLENFKKRTAKEHADGIRYAHEILMKELVKVLDDFDRVMAHLPKETSKAIQGLIEGLSFVHRDFLNILQKFGLKAIETEKEKFDPHQHEAINQTETNDHEEGTIVECHRKGYLYHDRLLRPASVTIAKSKETGEK